MKNSVNTFVAFLRGINVGGHHKVPMADLRKEMESLGFQQVTTILNTGNIIFDAADANEKQLEQKLANHLAGVFGFPIPVMIRSAQAVHDLWESEPFKDIEVTKEIRLYASLLAESPQVDISIPWSNENQSYKILDIKANIILSVLDLAVTKTPKGMEALEKLFGKNITTRNWNTIKRVIGKLEARS
ncbi:MAG: DUF1697 domain-containing protein [Bacteroidia bacterium]